MTDVKIGDVPERVYISWLLQKRSGDYDNWLEFFADMTDMADVLEDEDNELSRKDLDSLTYKELLSA